MCCDTAEYKSLFISHDQQSQTDLHGATPELDGNWSGLTGLRDSTGPTARTNENTHCYYSKKPTTIPKEIYIDVRTDLPEVIVHLNQASMMPPPEEMKEENKSVTDSVASKQYKK